MYRACNLVLCLCAFVASQSLVETETYGPHDDDLQVLLKDVNHIWLSGDPGWFTVFGPNAFPIVAGRTSSGLYRTMIAGGRYGNGRIIAAPHSSFVYRLSPPAPMDRDQFLLNAVNWLSPGQRATKIATLEAFPEEVNSIFTSKGIEVSVISWSDITNTTFISNFDVLSNVDVVPRDAIPYLLSYLQSDRGLLISATAWATSCCKDGEHFATAYSNNVITSKAGFVFAHAGGSRPNTPMNTYNTSLEYLKYLHYYDATVHIKDYIHGKIEADGDSLKRSMVVLWDARTTVF